MSTNTGTAPQALMASAVAMNVLAVVITSSPSPIPNPCRAKYNAEVPLPHPTAKEHWQNEANSDSKRSTGEGGFVHHRLKRFVDFLLNRFVLCL